MVERSATLDATFGALADATRRDILERLSRGQSRVTDLAKPYQMSLNAVSKHLRMLERAGLIVRTRRGREHHIRVNPAPIQAACDWIALYAKSWEQQFQALDEYLRDQQRTRGALGGRKRGTR